MPSPWNSASIRCASWVLNSSTGLDQMEQYRHRAVQRFVVCQRTTIGIRALRRRVQAKRAPASNFESTLMTSAIVHSFAGQSIVYS